ncbi:6-hydroxypseudooxynicotine dehydrogenase complex subunit alpha [Rhodoplanes serenus]|uniref:6-hydroxypseudooxynicotine dehydrogenase complex subunit alpha n=1 Tax=Rhodoplanes serenus TaxID=200615 RepID=A0A3S5CY44_9BRAD|nr:xanthine dehydrogenase family protein subunit M [Rhodoplanes serenus]VCU07277.1 6-hydroxypseudooxynicotine dehydrogenase complex subunit alpha [Rhodoplanes serenus]
MRPSSFRYHKAESVDHALELLARFGEDGRPLAGGQSLVPMMNLRLAAPEHLVDIGGLPLADIAFTDTAMRVGALVRHRQYLAEPRVAHHFPALHEAVTWIGHPTIRQNGTTGGSLSHADPTAELALAAMLYDAVMIVRSTAGERRIAAADFFEDAYVTALQPGEMLVAAEFPLPPAGSAGAFVEFAERRGDFAIAAVGVSITVADGRIATAAIACSGAEPRPIRAPEVEMMLSGRPLTDPQSRAAGRRLAAAIDPVGTFLTTADYRKALIGELTARAIDTACARAASR